MAIPSNLTVTPSSGSNNGAIKISSKTPYNGRNDRSSTITGKIVGESNSVTINVTEEGFNEFVDIALTTVNVDKDGQTLTINGTSNSSKLTFSWDSNGIGIASVTTYKVNGSITASSGTDITGDPGANEVFEFEVTLTIPKNTTTSSRTSNLKVTANNSTSDSVSIVQAAGDKYLWLVIENNTFAKVKIPQSGEIKTVEILSNTDWTFE